MISPFYYFNLIRDEDLTGFKETCQVVFLTW
jgi:hypothetical protein